MIVDSLVDIVVGTNIVVGLLEQLEDVEIYTQELKEAIADAKRLQEWMAKVDAPIAQKLEDMLNENSTSVERNAELATSEIIRQYVSSVDIAFSRIMKEIEKESV